MFHSSLADQIRCCCRYRQSTSTQNISIYTRLQGPQRQSLHKGSVHDPILRKKKKGVGGWRRLMLGWRLTERYSVILRYEKQDHWLWRAVQGLRIEALTAGTSGKTLWAVGSVFSSSRLCTLSTQDTLRSLSCVTNQTFLAVSLPSSGCSGALQVPLVAIFLSPSSIFPNNGTT